MTDTIITTKKPGRQLLTRDIVNERIAARGLSMEGDYFNSKLTAIFECREGHQWEATPSSVMAGSGCPHCSTRPPLTRDIVNERIAARGLSMVEPYVSSITKATFECANGHDWETTPRNVMAGSGCPHCSAKAPLTREIVNERIANRRLRMEGYYINSTTKATFKCAEGHQWMTTPRNVMAGSGCPHCFRDRDTKKGWRLLAH